MEGLRESEFLTALSVAATLSATASSSSQCESAEDESMMDSESLSTSMVEERIEASKCHWSELSNGDRSLSGEEMAADNREVFKTLQSHPEWGRLFKTFLVGEKFTEEWDGTLVVGEKFAEGGQAELFYVHVTWKDQNWRRFVSDNNIKYVLKVFKKGTLLRKLQGQWPHGFLKWNQEFYNGTSQLLLSPSAIYINTILCGTILEDGRFAYLMYMMEEDLQSLIKRKVHGQVNGCGPFSKKWSDRIMYKIALGVLWLHEHNVVHRDLKAANVLVGNQHHYRVADYECSNGVIGTGYWRAPEILQACKDGSVHQKPELFTKAADVYSYAMTCYEILTGMSPFQGEMVKVECVIRGERPMVPTFVDDWARKLLHRCWNSNPKARPSIQNILSIIATNTSLQGIKDLDVVRVRTKVTDVEMLRLKCHNPSHVFEEDYMPLGGELHTCKWCFETCNENVVKCTSCTNYYLHFGCALFPNLLISSQHPHAVKFNQSYRMGATKRRCDGCQLEISVESWYRCPVEGCDYDLHVRCAKYVGRILHPLHKEHILILSTTYIASSLTPSLITCETCKIQLNSMEFVYQCKECRFNIHPKCAIENVEPHRS